MTVRREFCCVDSFTALDDLKYRDQGDPIKVLRLLSKVGRFSVFEATSNQRIARTMDVLMASSWLRRIDEKSQYPWTYVELTDEGRKMLGAAA